MQIWGRQARAARQRKQLPSKALQTAGTTGNSGQAFHSRYIPCQLQSLARNHFISHHPPDTSIPLSLREISVSNPRSLLPHPNAFRFPSISLSIQVHHRDSSWQTHSFSRCRFSPASSANWSGPTVSLRKPHNNNRPQPRPAPPHR